MKEKGEMGIRVESRIENGEEEMKGESRKTRVAEIINKRCVFKGQAS